MKAIYVLALAAAAGISSVSFAQVTGTVKLEGAAPEMAEIDMSGVAECAAQHVDPVHEETVVAGENGELANVIIAISPEANPDVVGDAPADAVVIDQQGCQYHPHVLSMTTGQKFVVKNSDPFLHNVHSMSEANPQFNFGQPNVDPGKEVESPVVPEYFHVKCDVHPWMSAYVGVFPHPYHAVSAEDGTFSIANVPDGEYTFVAWHEKYGTQEQTATVADGKAELSFSFNAESASAAPVVREVILASAAAESTEGQKDCADKKECCPAGEEKPAADEAKKECDDADKAQCPAGGEAEKSQCPAGGDKKDCEKPADSGEQAQAE